MESTFLFSALLLCAVSLFCKTNTGRYALLIREAASLYQVKKFEKSAFAFSEAFKANGWNYTDYGHIKGDPDLKSLYRDKRLQSFTELVKVNKDIAYANIDFITVNGYKAEVLTSGIQNNNPNKPAVVFENGMAGSFGSCMESTSIAHNPATIFSRMTPTWYFQELNWLYWIMIKSKKNKKPAARQLGANY